MQSVIAVPRTIARRGVGPNGGCRGLCILKSTAVRRSSRGDPRCRDPTAASKVLVATFMLLERSAWSRRSPTTSTRSRLEVMERPESVLEAARPDRQAESTEDRDARDLLRAAVQKIHRVAGRPHGLQLDLLPIHTRNYNVVITTN